MNCVDFKTFISDNHVDCVEAIRAANTDKDVATTNHLITLPFSKYRFRLNS